MRHKRIKYEPEFLEMAIHFIASQEQDLPEEVTKYDRQIKDYLAKNGCRVIDRTLIEKRAHLFLDGRGAELYE